ncbi:MAG: Fic family protein [Flavobacterium sp.]|nr:Fic family protein [Flavobacterium sp.]
MNNLQLIQLDLLTEYLARVGKLQTSFDALKEAEISTKLFSFYTSVASVFSSKIEGENIELDSYVKHKAMGVQFQPNYMRKIDDLYNAYTFAQANSLTPLNIKEAHALLSANILETSKQGKFRNQNMYVTTNDGRIEYLAVSPFELPIEMDKWYSDVAYLFQKEMSIEEVFYYAAYLHLVFVKIHPFNDGNGRTARLIEKWFISEKLGAKTWFLQSEKNYYLQHALYYTNLRRLGLEYPQLDYNKALEFLLMLPTCLEI